jgi:hypothetical protein
MQVDKKCAILVAVIGNRAFEMTIGQPFPISSCRIPHGNWINVFKRDHLSSHQQAAAMQSPPAINDAVAITKIVQV